MTEIPGKRPWYAHPQLNSMRVAELIFYLIRDQIERGKIVFDPMVGTGTLLIPWARAGWPVLGYDINIDCIEWAETRFEKLGLRGVFKFADSTRDMWPQDPALIVFSPPSTNIRPAYPSACRETGLSWAELRKIQEQFRMSREDIRNTMRIIYSRVFGYEDVPVVVVLQHKPFAPRPKRTRDCTFYTKYSKILFYNITPQLWNMEVDDIVEP